MKVKFPKDVSAVSHEGETYEPDDKGYCTVPDDKERTLAWFREQHYEMKEEKKDPPKAPAA